VHLHRSLDQGAVQVAGAVRDDLRAEVPQLAGQQVVVGDDEDPVDHLAAQQRGDGVRSEGGGELAPDAVPEAAEPGLGVGGALHRHQDGEVGWLRRGCGHRR
jgi:hypothetical protein